MTETKVTKYTESVKEEIGSNFLKTQLFDFSKVLFSVLKPNLYQYPQYNNFETYTRILYVGKLYMVSSSKEKAIEQTTRY